MSGNLNLNDLEYSDANFNKYRYAEKSVVFTGAAGLGATGTIPLFTVTGTVIARVVAVCSDNLVSSGGTIEVGVTGGTAGLIAQTTASDIDANEIWHDATPDKGIELSSVGAENIIANGLDIFATVASADVTAGTLKFFVIWKPVSQDGNIVAA